MCDLQQKLLLLDITSTNSLLVKLLEWSLAPQPQASVCYKHSVDVLLEITTKLHVFTKAYDSQKLVGKQRKEKFTAHVQLCRQWKEPRHNLAPHFSHFLITHTTPHPGFSTCTRGWLTEWRGELQYPHIPQKILTWKNWYAMTQSSITGLSIPLDAP